MSRALTKRARRTRRTRRRKQKGGWPWAKTPGKWESLIQKFGAKFNYPQEVVDAANSAREQIDRDGYLRKNQPDNKDNKKAILFLKHFSKEQFIRQFANNHYDKSIVDLAVPVILAGNIVSNNAELNPFIQDFTTQMGSLFKLHNDILRLIEHVTHQVYSKQINITFEEINKQLNTQTGGGKWKLLVDGIHAMFCNDESLRKEAYRKMDALPKDDFEGKKKVILETFTLDKISKNTEQFKKFITNLMKVSKEQDKQENTIINMHLGLLDPSMKNNPAFL